MTATVQALLLTLGFVYPTVASSTVEKSAPASNYSALHDLAANITCLHSVPCTADLASTCYETSYVDNCYHRCTFSALKDGWSRANDVEDCLLYAKMSQYLSSWLALNATRKILASSPLFVSDVKEETTNVLAACMVGFCNLSPRCVGGIDTGCTLNDLLLPDGSVATSAVVSCKASICPGLAVNADIFGIGVYIASILQIAVASLFVIMLSALQFLRYTEARQYRLLPAVRSRLSRAGARVQGTISRLAQIEAAYRVIWETTASFQLTQCYYILALTIATIYAIAPLGVRELNELDQQALIFISGCNICLTSIILMIVVFTDRENVTMFMFYFSFLNWFAALISSQFVPGAVPYYQAYRQTPGPSCSNKTLLELCETDMQLLSPKWYCLTALIIVPCFFTFHHELGRKIWNGCSALTRSLALVAFIKAGARLLKAELLIQGRWYALITWVSRAMKPRWPILKNLIPLSACIISMSLWFDLLRTSAFQRAIPSKWTFGQVIALVVWLPVLIEILGRIWTEFGENRRCQGKRRLENQQNSDQLPLHGQYNASDQALSNGATDQAHPLSTYSVSAPWHMPGLHLGPKSSCGGITSLNQPLSQQTSQSSHASSSYFSPDDIPFHYYQV